MNTDSARLQFLLDAVNATRDVEKASFLGVVVTCKVCCRFTRLPGSVNLQLENMSLNLENLENMSLSISHVTLLFRRFPLYMDKAAENFPQLGDALFIC